MQPVINVLTMVAQNDTTSSTETSLLREIATGSWPKYREAQKTELNLLLQIINNPGQYKTIGNMVSKISADAGLLNSTYNDVNRDWNQLGSYVSSISKHVNGVDTNETQPIIMST